LPFEGNCISIFTEGSTAPKPPYAANWGLYITSPTQLIQTFMVPLDMSDPGFSNKSEEWDRIEGWSAFTELEI